MYIDFKDLKAQIAVETVADMLELELTFTAESWHRGCPGVQGRQ